MKSSPGKNSLYRSHSRFVKQMIRMKDPPRGVPRKKLVRQQGSLAQVQGKETAE